MKTENFLVGEIHIHKVQMTTNSKSFWDVRGKVV